MVWWKRYEEATANRSSTKGQIKLLEYVPPAAQPGPWQKIVTSKKSLMLFGPQNRFREVCIWLTSSDTVVSLDPKSIEKSSEHLTSSAAADEDPRKHSSSGSSRDVAATHGRRGAKTRLPRPPPSSLSSRRGSQGCWRRVLGRRKVQRLAKLVFQAVHVFAVAVLLVVVALDAELTSGRRAPADETGTMRNLETVAVSVCLAEALVLVVAQGFILLPGAYLRDSFNVFSLSLTVMSAVCLWVFGGAAWAGSLSVSTLKALRALNVFRLLKFSRLSRSLTDLLVAIRSSGKSLCLVGGAVLFFWLQWAIVGLQVLWSSACMYIGSKGAS